MRYIILSCLCLLIAGCAVPIRGSGLSVRLGEYVYPLVFELNDCPRALKRIVAEDIQLSFSPASTFATVTNDPPKAYTINGQRYHSSQSLHPEGRTYNRIKAWLVNNFGDVVEIHGKRFLVITEKVSQRYARAMEFQNKHSEAWQQLVKFIATLNAVDAEHNPVASKPEDFVFVYPKEKYDTVVAGEEFRRFCADVPNTKFHTPSILEYRTEKSESPNILVCRTFVEGFGSVRVSDGKMDLVYDHGKWKFLFVVF